MADKLNALARAPVNALSSLYDLYQRRVGRPFQQAVRGGVRGYFGLPLMSDADATGREAYRQGEALGYTPGVGMPAGAVRLAAEGVQALLLVQEPRLLALQKAVAVHRLLAQVFQQSCSGSQLHFQTCITDMRQLCQHRPFSL